MSRALATALLGAALALSAAAFDTPSLYVPGLALAALGLVAGAWVLLAARGARVERAPGPATVEEEQPYPLRLRVRSGLLPPPGGELVEPLLGWPVPVTGRWSRRVRINVRFGRRGRRRLEPSRLVIRDPLGLAVREVIADQHGELLVLPRVEPVVGASPSGATAQGASGKGLAGDADSRVARRLAGSAAELEMDTLRPYREGTPASRIHWPAVARTGEILERRLVADAESGPLVVLDARAPASPEALDAAVRAAASLCVHLARRAGCELLLPGDRRPVRVGRDLASWPSLHARLALVEPAGRAPAIGCLRGGRAAFWVVAARSGRVPGALQRMTGERYLVTPHAAAGRRASFTVAGCSGYDVGRAAGRRAA